MYIIHIHVLLVREPYFFYGASSEGVYTYWSYLGRQMKFATTMYNYLDFCATTKISIIILHNQCYMLLIYCFFECPPPPIITFTQIKLHSVIVHSLKSLGFCWHWRKKAKEPQEWWPPNSVVYRHVHAGNIDSDTIVYSVSLSSTTT